ncbi:MAG: DNA-directed RNA polymerase subunit alpha C-terminal domain-containing protein [Fusobacteriaceae bacterium]
MVKYKKSDLIESLDISIRSKNALQIKNIKKLEDLLKYSENDLYEIQYLGKKSINELLIIINSFKKNSNFINENYFINKNQKKCINFKIDDLKLSVRCKNALKIKNINFLSEILLLNEIEIREIKNLGEKSKIEILNFQKEVILEEIDNLIDYSEEFINLIKTLEQEFNDIIIFSKSTINQIYLLFFQENNLFDFKIDDDYFLKKLLSIKNIRENFKSNMIQNIKLYFCVLLLLF